MTVWTIVVAAGSGARFGGPKQFEHLAGQRVIDRSLATAAAASDGVVAVVPAGEEQSVAADIVVPGGATRAASVRAGLAVVPADATQILVHDGARPLATAALYRRVIDALDGGAIGVVPGVSVTDSIRSRAAGALDRSDLVAVQTPQGFDAATLRAAHSGGGEATDDAALVETIGGEISIVDGEVENIKITDPHDVAVAERLLG